MEVKRNYSPIPVLDTGNLTPEEFTKVRQCADGLTRYTLGGSDAGCVIGVSPYKTSLALFEEKKGLSNKSFSLSSKKAMQRGHKYEDYVAEGCRDVLIERGYEIVEFKNDTMMYRHGEYLKDEDGCYILDANDEPVLRYPWAVANLDRIATLRKGNKTFRAVIECKTVRSSAFDTIRNWKAGIVPPHYEAQVRFYMAVMNIDTAFIACKWDLEEDSIAVIEIERDLYIEEELMNECDLFIKALETDIPPNLNGTSKALKGYYEAKYGPSIKGEVFDTSTLDEAVKSSLIATGRKIDDLKKERDIYLAKADSIKERIDKITVNTFFPLMKTAEKLVVEDADGKKLCVEIKSTHKRLTLDTEAYLKANPNTPYLKVDETALKKNEPETYNAFTFKPADEPERKIETYYVQSKGKGVA